MAVAASMSAYLDETLLSTTIWSQNMTRDERSTCARRRMSQPASVRRGRCGPRVRVPDARRAPKGGLQQTRPNTKAGEGEMLRKDRVQGNVEWWRGRR